MGLAAPPERASPAEKHGGAGWSTATGPFWSESLMGLRCRRVDARALCTGGIAYPKCYSITALSVAGRGRRIDPGGWRKPTNDQPMHWWRAKRRNGAWLALGALLLQLTLSFGHIHSE